MLFAVVVWYLAKDGPDDTVTPTTMWFGAGGATVFSFMNSVNTVVFAYANQCNVPQLTGELSPEPSVDRMSNVGLITIVMCFVLFTGVSIFGVLAFGVGVNQGDALVVVVTPAHERPLVLLTWLAAMFSVRPCFPFHVYPIRQFTACAIRKGLGREAGDEKSDATYGGRSLTRWLEIASAIVSVIVIELIAVVITSLTTAWNFIGAFAAAYISYVVPPLWVSQLRRRQPGLT